MVVITRLLEASVQDFGIATEVTVAPSSNLCFGVKMTSKNVPTIITTKPIATGTAYFSKFCEKEDLIFGDLNTVCIFFTVSFIVLLSERAEKLGAEFAFGGDFLFSEGLLIF